MDKLTSTAHPFTYTGRRWDPDLNLYYYRARWYDPGLGTFLQTDPIGSLDYVNLYSYVGAEPGNGTDPTGKYICRATKAQCDVFRAGLASASAARDTYRRGSAEYRRIDASVRSYGREGQRYGVTVQAGNLNEGNLAHVGVAGGQIVATFDFGQLYSKSQLPSSLSSGNTIYAGVIGHEGKHVWQRQQGNPMTREGAYLRETAAYSTQVYIMKALGVRVDSLTETRFIREGATRSSSSCDSCND